MSLRYNKDVLTFVIKSHALSRPQMRSSALLNLMKRTQPIGARALMRA